VSQETCQPLIAYSTVGGTDGGQDVQAVRL